MYGGGLQELLDILYTLDTNHPGGLLVTESCGASLKFHDFTVWVTTIVFISEKQTEQSRKIELRLGPIQCSMIARLNTKAHDDYK